LEEVKRCGCRGGAEECGNKEARRKMVGEREEEGGGRREGTNGEGDTELEPKP
jgi:hypothetical protein